MKPRAIPRWRSVKAVPSTQTTNRAPVHLMPHVAHIASRDFSTGRAALTLAVLYAFTRFPLLGGGYGADTDAYRVVLVARYLWATAAYLPSRLPGYPLHELVTALLVWGGPRSTNGATALVALVGVLVFARLARELRVPSPGMVTLGFAFIPYLVVTSTTTLDYHWALAAMLGAYLAVVRGHFVCAGLLLGVAVGFRITAGAFLLPLLFIPVGQRRWRAAAMLAGVTFVVSFLLYLPVAIPYRFDFLRFADSRVSPDGVIRVVGQWALGAAGSVAVLVALLCSWRRVAALPKLAQEDVHVLVWLLTVALYGVAFVRLPVDLGYLVPVYPFGLLLLAKVLRPALLTGALAVVLVSGFVDLDIQQLHNFSPRIAAETVRPSWRVAGIWHDQRARRRWERYARAIPDAPVPERSVVLTGGAFPNVAVLHWGRLRYAIVARDRQAISMLSDNGSMTDDARDVVYLAVSTPEVIARYRAQGYTIFRAEPADPSWRTVLLVPAP